MISNFNVSRSDLIKLFTILGDENPEEMAAAFNIIKGRSDDMPEDFGYALLSDVIENVYDNIDKDKLFNAEFANLNINKLLELI